MTVVRGPAESDRWADTVGGLLASRTPPEAIRWEDPFEEAGLFAGAGDGSPMTEPVPEGHGGCPAGVVSILRPLCDRARVVLCHRDQSRWAVLYRIAWRVCVEGDRGLLGDAADPDVRRLEVLEKQVRFDAHKAKAFVRFRKTEADDGGEWYTAWHRPAHRVVRLVAPFFAKRFGSMRWTIFTPDESADWDGERLVLGDGVPADPLGTADELERLWKTYYASIFNPARVKVGAMLREMPKRYWSTMPETSLIEELLSEAGPRVREMLRSSGTDPSAEDYLPPEGHRSLPQLASAAKQCEGCPLHGPASRVVFGEGPADASLMLVGEQPGDQEDLAGRPFVGPAGELLDRALREAGIDRDGVYVTNAVKHFHHELNRKIRTHKRPSVTHVRACQPWLREEIGRVSPRVIVALGVTAGKALEGQPFVMGERRGRMVWSDRWDASVLATDHPSSILRGNAEPVGSAAFAGLVRDLSLAASAVALPGE